MGRNAKPPSKWPLGPYGLSIVLGTLFLSSWLAQFVTQLQEVRDEAAEHGQSFEWGQFWTVFGRSTFENWQSEFLQLLTFVVLTTYLIHRGSAESKDSDEEIHAALERIEARLAGVERGLSGDEPRSTGSKSAGNAEAGRTQHQPNEPEQEPASRSG